jgi:DNA-binding protein H-NS
MSGTLDAMSVAELDALIGQATKAREETRERRRRELKSEIEARLKHEGFQVAEVLGSKQKPGSLPAKYTDDTGRSWSGKGRMPGWLQERIDKGEPLERFLIGKAKA